MTILLEKMLWKVSLNCLFKHIIGICHIYHKFPAVPNKNIRFSFSFQHCHFSKSEMKQVSFDLPVMLLQIFKPDFLG